MKKMIIIMMLLFASLAVADNTTVNLSDCKLKYMYTGNYYGRCPMGMVVTGVRVNHPQGPFMPTTWVECARLSVECSVDKNDNWTE